MTTVKEAIESLQQAEDNDLWQQLDYALKAASVATHPPGSFTLGDFKKRYPSMSRDQAYRAISKLIATGKVTRHGQGNATYYMMVKT